MTRHPARFLAALSVCGLLLTSCTGTSSQGKVFRDSAVPAGGMRLVAFDSCADLLSGLRSAAKTAVGPWGFGSGGVADLAGGGRNAAEAAPGGKAAAPEAPTHSKTNTHEAGVDEPDLVKTDGKRIVTVQGGVLRVVDASARKVTGSVQVSDSATADGPRPGLTQLLVAGDHALVLGQRHAKYGPDGQPDDAIAGPDLTLVDISGAPRVIGRFGVDGNLVDARQVGSTARVVVRSSPRLAFPRPKGGSDDARLAANQETIDRAPVERWLPRYVTTDADGKRTTGRIDCNTVSRPAEYSGTALLTVLTFDLGKSSLGSGDPVSLVADGDTVYANGPSLYVANDQRWRIQPMSAKRTGGRPAVEPKTELYKFDIGGTAKPRFAAAGEVPGWLLNQYSLSEWDGHLRVATTEGQPWDRSGSSASTVFVLRQDRDRLVETGKVGGLGKGERIYSVRFIGTTGYVVTFRQTDPLYTVDLRDPKAPKVLGELKITGYSAYLHPAGNGRLIGIGQEASEQGRRQGTQVSLFDVSDLTKPGRLAQHHVENGHSEAEFDPHAFLYWPETGLLVVPLSRYTKLGGGQGALVLTVRDGGISELGSVTHSADAGQIRRSLVIDRTLWTVSHAGLKANDLSTLAETAWVALR